ncbi:putative mitochondrial hypothetical protein [Leptomonas pyrrhocoris]|uniref:Uncharacterized protein n=1 Tax=Leptomonas pyrrhocoris TaxID=157538 RepID=A0A0N1J4V8_LEPPY|nr:putative mitochondrial hypothetical protein [Leptomonas pyrrhocoris]KPA80921.1 putative mitochondrial hypothetical protein [Leptomonas pyrrhocoris]|eukprot:XP_015659360.1 putative mitochondrial hypothetical protein [Leptomonas pyrrhocoris]
MYPKQVPADFTPFPLPKHDESLGFGPVRLRNVPDVEEARLRMDSAAAARPRKSNSRPATTATMMSQLEPEVESAEVLTAAMLWGDLNTENMDDATSAAMTDVVVPHPGSGASSSSPAVGTPSTAANDAEDNDGDGNELGGYHTHPQFPLLDILECDRSVEDLLAQFWDRPQREARTATVLDFASTLQKRSNEELTRILYELSSLFTWDGNGLQFLVTKVVKFGRGYTVTSELTKAFVVLVDAMTVAFVEAQPQRLAESPDLFAQVLHFLALVKIMEPNKWYSLTANSMQNRADYSHPRGINQTTAYVTTGRNLLDFLEDIVTSGHEVDENADVPLPLKETDEDAARALRLTATWTPDNILDVLAGFAGVMPDGKASSAVVTALLDELWRQWSRLDFELTTPQHAEQLERLYMLLQVMDVQRDAVLDALLGGQLRGHRRASGSSAPLFRERDDTPPLKLAASLTAVRGPDFFSGVSKDRRAEVKAAALKVLTASLARARATQDEPLLQALVEGGTELLQSLDDKELARTLAQREGFDTAILKAVPHMSSVADRLTAQDPSWSVYPLTRTVKGGLPDTNAVLAHLRTHPVPYVAAFQGRRVHPVRTFTANLDFIKSMDNVFVLHSSGVSTHVSGLVSVVRRLRSGKDALIVTSSCLRALQAAAQYGRTERIRGRADRALNIVAYELESGRAILLPLSEELYLHDAGTYCDEDLMLWTLAAYLARDLPLVKVHTIMSKLSPARNPHHMLKAEFSPVARTTDLYDASTPLLRSLRSKELRSVTHHPVLQRPVADRPPSLHNVNQIRARFVYRRDKALFDKYHVTARNLAPGFSQGALNSDLRGLGFYTPDHPQVRYTPVSELVVRPVQR